MVVPEEPLSCGQSLTDAISAHALQALLESPQGSDRVVLNTGRWGDGQRLRSLTMTLTVCRAAKSLAGCGILGPRRLFLGKIRQRYIGINRQHPFHLADGCCVLGVQLGLDLKGLAINFGARFQ